MPRVEWDKVPDAQSFSPLPDGQYECRVAKCVETLTTKGDPRFRIEFEVISGQHSGRKIFDSILFPLSDLEGGAMRRTKFVLSRLGFYVEKALNVEASELVGRKVWVICAGVDKYEKNGKRYENNIVPFDGYVKHGEQDDDPLPF